MNCRVLTCGRCGLQFCVVIGVRYFYAVEIPVLCGGRRIFGREPRVLMCVLCSVCFILLLMVFLCRGICCFLVGVYAIGIVLFCTFITFCHCVHYICLVLDGLCVVSTWLCCFLCWCLCNRNCFIMHFFTFCHCVHYICLVLDGSCVVSTFVMLPVL